MKKAIKSVLVMLIGGLVGIGITEKRNRKKIDAAWKMSEKHFNLFIMMSEWVRIKQEGKSIADYLALLKTQRKKVRKRPWKMRINVHGKELCGL